MSHPTRARDIMIGVRNGGKLLVFDPRFTQIASKAELFLLLRPGTVDALALGMLNLIIQENFMMGNLLRNGVLVLKSFESE